jgi:hypothetical protein
MLGGLVAFERSFAGRSGDLASGSIGFDGSEPRPSGTGRTTPMRSEGIGLVRRQPSIDG